LATVPTPPLLQKLLTTPGPSGYEGDAASVWREAAVGFAEVSADALGSSVARVRGTGEGPLLAIVGHIDEIGVHVSHVDDDGFLRFGSVGGWDPIILVGQRVTLVTRSGEIPGVIGKKPIHLMKDEDRKRVPELKDLHIDIGAKDGDDAHSMVRIGDVAVIAGEPVELPNGRLVSRALDNRIGCYVALEAARLVAAVQEEITFAGSRTTAFSLAPDLAVAVDVTFATDQPGVELGELTRHPLGSGPSLTRGSTIHPRVFELLHETAEAEGIAFTVASAGRGTGTDADAIHLSRAGIPTALVSVPLRYMHSPVELCELEDVTNAAKLIAAFALRLDGALDLTR
jgi:putative aminopeptidase FrvX